MSSSSIIAIVVVFAALATAAAHEDLYTPGGKVVQVTAASFKNKVLSSKIPALVEFYAPWCGYCKNLASDYRRTATKLGSIATVAAVNADLSENKALSQRYGVQGFPTIKWFAPGRDPIDYTGERTAKAMVSFVKSNMPSLVQAVTLTNLDQFLSKNDTPKALFFMPDAKVDPFYKSLSLSLSDRILFGHVSKKSSAVVFDRFGVVDRGALLVVPIGDGDPIRYDGKLLTNKENVADFLRRNARRRRRRRPRDTSSSSSLPALTDRSMLNKFCLDSVVPLCVIAMTSSSDDIDQLDVIVDVAKAEKETMFKFGWIDGSKSELVAAFGIGVVDRMSVAVWNPRKAVVSLYQGDIEEKYIKEHLSRVTSPKGSTGTMRTTPPLDREEL